MGDPVTTDERAVAACFDRCAAQGGLGVFEPEEEGRVRAIEGRWRLRPGERVLEVGCGTGRLTERIASAVAPHGAVVAFDLSLGMLANARRRLARSAVGLAGASASRLPWPDRSFDRVLLFCVLPHLVDHAAAFAEVARVLRPAGSLWIDHLADRSAVNSFHRGLGGELAEHLIPPEPVLLDWLELAGLDVLALGDGPVGFHARATRRA